MHRIRFKVLAFASFVVAFLLSSFTPGTWVNRSIATVMSGLMGIWSPGVVANIWGSDRAVAADVPVLVGQRSGEFDNSPSIAETSSNQSNIPAYPNQVSPSQPIRADFNTSETGPKITFSSDNPASELQNILDELQAAGGPGSALEGIPEQICYMAQTVVDTYNAGAHQTGIGITAESSPSELRGKLGNTASDVKKLSEGIDRLISGLNMSKFNQNAIKAIAWDQIKERLVPDAEFKLNCDKYSTPKNENYDSCRMCHYRVSLQKKEGNGEEKVTNGVTLFANCADANNPGKVLAMMKPQVDKLDREDARIEQERNLPRSSKRRIIGMPELITDSSTQGKNCGHNYAATAGLMAANSVPTYVCNVPKKFWENKTRYIVGVWMNEFYCLVPGKVMTDNGEADGKKSCALCSWMSNGMAPRKTSCSQPEDSYRRSPVPACPAN